MNAAELRDCPCCHAQARLSSVYQDCDGNPAVECSKCNLLSWTTGDWNTRAQAELKECQEAFDAWYAMQRHQLSNEQVCNVIWKAAWNARARQAEHSDAEAVPVAYVPVHPKTGPLWMDTYAAGSNPDRARYPRMELFTHHPRASVDTKDRLLAALERASMAESALRELVDECGNDTHAGWEDRMNYCITRANSILARQTSSMTRGMWRYVK